MENFNLIDHPWIPVRWKSTSAENPPLVSLNDAFSRGEEIADLDCLPHERIALMRLLVCITQSALEAPATPDDWNTFDTNLASSIPAYLNQENIHPHFNLTGDGPRWLQTKPKNISPKDQKPLSKLSFHLASGNNPTLLDHWGEATRPWQASDAALLLLCLQNFFVGGSMASAVKGNGPALKALHLILQGDSLTQTILANCLDHHTIASTGQPLGKPVWEAPADQTLLSRLAPRPCALWLSDDLTTVSIAQGHQYLDFDAIREPSTTLRIDPKKGDRYLLRASPGRGVWRDLHLLTCLKVGEESTGDPSLVLKAYYEREEHLGSNIRFWVGELIKANDAKILNSTESSFTVASTIFTPQGHLTYHAGIDFADNISKKLYGAVKFFASQLGSEAAPTEAAQQNYWHTLDHEHRQLIHLAEQAENYPLPKAIGSEGATDLWTKTIQKAALAAYEAVCPRTTPRQIQAYAAGIKPLYRALYPSKQKTKPAAKATK
ncbi:MAG: type I-E CRISPR-associated protein Cse1/CasA [Akkermansiaceae bacterium]|nr:type I-E CRISPR-associated protein Cse1/CasA [Akkermansiaceae bacterium]